MNVRCESCEALYRIDPSKVPAAGVRARCTFCSSVIAVPPPGEVDRPRPRHTPEAAERFAQSLGDALIMPPEEPAPSAFEAAAPEPPPRLTPSPAPAAPAPSPRAAAEAPTERMDAVPSPAPPPRAPAPASPPPPPPRLSEAPTTPITAVVPPVPPRAEPPPEAAPPAAAAPPPPAQPGRSRFSRPFSVPRELTPPPKAAPPRPTAPVFRPTPGQPIQAPPVPPPAQPTPPAQPAPPAAKPKPINPFLSRDPGQKARRLARALISDMIVYQPEKRQRALAEGNLKEAFGDEIKKSWEEYVDQVGRDVAESTTHFSDALNDILAGGQKLF